ncbi:MAG TPA: c-type cytochrome domain-containing protein, partial [Nitrolancea sp.]|nr:c-type cytochrome domain-containing protein [Nitrolancea sp.]
ACGSSGGQGAATAAATQGGAPRMVRIQASPPPTVTIAPTVAPNSAQPVSFSQDIEPILTSQCGSCHGGQGGLWLLSYEQVMLGGSSGAVVVPGQPEQSQLYLRITGKATPAMPLNSPALPQSEIDAIRGWIAEGAPKN